MNKYGLIGEKLGHSFSPHIHKELGDYDYQLYPLQPQELDRFFQDNDLSGFNVTIPYKLAVIPYCQELSPRAKAIGSVNTIVKRPDGSYYGDNTDYYGFLMMLGDSSAFAGKKALVLGSGGASKTVCAVLSGCGTQPVVISRSGENNYNNLYLHKDAVLIVNATPVGMYPNNGVSPIDLSLFPNCQLVLDLIYNPAKTALMLQAEKLGIPSKNGLFMLAAQAKAAAELFLGTSIPDSRSEEIEEKLKNQLKNIALIGMPGSGKSAVGARLAEILNRRFLDMDALVQQHTGRKIPEIFATDGEETFRKIETEILKLYSAESGCVIATGGGVVTRPENKDLLDQNSVVVLIETDLDKLHTDGRPVSQAKGVEKIYEERQQLYLAWSEYRVKNDITVQVTADRIKEMLKL